MFVCVCVCLCVCVCVCDRFEMSHCDLWFIRFCVDYQHKLLFLGNTLGKLFYWDLTASDPAKMK